MTSFAGRVLVVAAIVIALAVVWVGYAGSLLVATDEVGRPRAVFAFSGDVLGDRERRAIELAWETDADRLVFFLDGGAGQASPAQLRQLAVAAGVPVDAVRSVGGVDSTEMEAGLAAGLVDRQGWESVTLVTSPSHTRRAGWTFRRAIGDPSRRAGHRLGGPIRRRSVVAHERRPGAGTGEWAKLIGSTWYVVDPPESIESDVPC
jgi:uncharacterized SAM-binding protein YcdF (DUF218 family)